MLLFYYLSLIETEEDKALFLTWYEEYQQKMFYIANSILDDSWSAEDAVSNAFVKIAEHINRIKEIDKCKLEGYIIVIVENEAKRIYNKRKKYVFSKGEDAEDSENDKEEYFLFKASNEEADMSFFDTIDCNEILTAIKRLPDKYKNVLLLKYYHDCSNKELGRIFNINASAAQKRVERARILLKKEIGYNDEKDSRNMFK